MSDKSERSLGQPCIDGTVKSKTIKVFDREPNYATRPKILQWV